MKYFPNEPPISKYVTLPQKQTPSPGLQLTHLSNPLLLMPFYDKCFISLVHTTTIYMIIM